MAIGLKVDHVYDGARSDSVATVAQSNPSMALFHEVSVFPAYMKYSGHPYYYVRQFDPNKDD